MTKYQRMLIITISKMLNASRGHAIKIFHQEHQRSQNEQLLTLGIL